MTYDLRTKFHEIWYRRSNNIKILHLKFEKNVMLVLLMGETYEVRLLDGLRCHSILITLHKNQFQHSNIVREILIQTQRER